MGERNGNGRPVGPRYALRLSDLRAWHVVTGVCGRCGRRGRIDLRDLAAGRAEHERVVDLERRLRCTRCGNRAGNLILATMAGRD